MAKSLLKVIFAGLLLFNGLYADIILNQTSDGNIEFLPVDSTEVDAGEVINILKFQYLLREGISLHIKNGNFSPDVYLPTYEELKSAPYGE